MTILITCETSGDAVVPWLPAGRVPAGVSTVDVCAGRVAERIGHQLHAPCVKHNFRRDLIDVSHSLGHRGLFGQCAAGLDDDAKWRLIDSLYFPYRERVWQAVKQILQQFSFVLHLSVRSFAAKYRGTHRRTDVGLLYDPSREAELNLCVDWIDELYELYPNLRARRNYPRRGTVDSLTKAMRREFAPEEYMGVEVWLNRAWVDRNVRLRDEALWYLADSLRVTLGLPAEEHAEKVA